MAILSPAPTATTAFSPPHAFPKFDTKNPPSLISLPFPIDPTRPFFLPRINRKVCIRPLLAALPPQQPDPPPEKDPIRRQGIAATLSRFQDRVQIFFAVLFWMSLFFWASAWDGRNSGSGPSGRRNKGSQFKR